MRKTFANLLLEETKNNSNIITITGDLGYKLWDDYRKELPNNFYNVGSAEQLMIGMAVGLHYTGKIPICYSITPFLLYRPFELIRNYVNYENTPIKLVGSGRDNDYEHDGISHWAHDDEMILKSFTNIVIWKPKSLEELKNGFKDFLYSNKPYYLNLTKQILTHENSL
jgi:transketolase